MNFVFSAVILIGVIVWLRAASKNKSKFGVNLQLVNCPVCNTQQPVVRVPKNINQALYGGTTCPNCKTKIDKYGAIVP